jgi:ATP-dependent Clp protease adaptor protein ClpS
MGARSSTARPGASPEVGTESETRLCPRYRVLIHNDPVTTFEFVIAVLAAVFQKPGREADQIAHEAHGRGLALVALLPLEQAEFKVDRAHSLARAAKYPLKFTYEPEG